MLGISGFNIAMRYPDNEIAIGITIAVYGGAGLAALPLMNELIVETTYPVGEATSTGVSMMASQLVAALLVALSAIVPSSGSDDYPHTVCRDGESQDLTWYLLFVNGIFILYYPFFVYFYRKFIQIQFKYPVSEIRKFPWNRHQTTFKISLTGYLNSI